MRLRLIRRRVNDLSGTKRHGGEALAYIPPVALSFDRSFRPTESGHLAIRSYGNQARKKKVRGTKLQTARVAVRSRFLRSSLFQLHQCSDPGLQVRPVERREQFLVRMDAERVQILPDGAFKENRVLETKENRSEDSDFAGNKG